MHIRCLDALRIQGSVNEKNTIAREPTKQASATEAHSLILLPYGIADSSDELSEDEDNDNILKPKRDSTDAIDEAPEQGNAAKVITKLRIKTGGTNRVFLSFMKVD